MNKEERYQYIRGQFIQRGFINDPRGEGFERSLYNPELNIIVHICNISRLSVGIHVCDMSENGMTWGKAFYELPQGIEIRYNFEKRSFDSFYNVTFKNRVKKLNEILEKLK
jgi:hypothetical protein